MAAVILVVDDDQATLEGLVALLEGAGYSTLGAPTYAEGRRVLTQVPVDLLVVDVRLGEYNGLQLVVLASSLPNAPAAIVTSGYEDRVLEEEARRLGAPFFLKPIHLPDFLGLIAKTLADRNP